MAMIGSLCVCAYREKSYILRQEMLVGLYFSLYSAKNCYAQLNKQTNKQYAFICSDKYIILMNKISV